MISDEYTREYDELEALRLQNRKIDRVERVAEGFGCSIDVNINHKETTINVYLPNGTLFHRFDTLKKAVEWAERWGQKTN